MSKKQYFQPIGALNMTQKLPSSVPKKTEWALSSREMTFGSFHTDGKSAVRREHRLEWELWTRLLRTFAVKDNRIRKKEEVRQEMEAGGLGVKGIGTEKGQAEKEFHKVTHQALTKSTMFLSQTDCNRHPRGKARLLTGLHPMRMCKKKNKKTTTNKN